MRMKIVKRVLVLFITGAAISILAACGPFNGMFGGAGEKPIGKEAAAEALNESLEGLSYDTSFQREADIDGIKCYLYTAVKDGKESEELLAVNAVSGEVMAYDPESGKLLSFDRSAFFVDDGETPLSWDGEFECTPYSLVLMPADDQSFEFEFKKGGESLLYDIARVSDSDTHKAEGESEGTKVTFIQKNGSIEVKCDGDLTEIAGVYELK